ncbi:hypothetical protein OSB04_un000267 [Centaurea solstitialis]|uniref:MLO-like protein n=1 Tax=Centaurea solstitialis TaxID=347529 RepID=A0AA38SD08_9ASTR|nr:hypothetical protein OSB04_un000267 [Centaurea solstitialis]
MLEASRSLEYTPTWIVAIVCSIIVLVSLLAERGLHHLGKWLKRHHQDALYEALQKLEEELMLLGFISLLLTVSQRTISKICIPPHLANYMLPCERKEGSKTSQHLISDFGRRHLLSEEDLGTHHCMAKGKVQLMSLEGLHQLHIFVFVLAVVHVIFCATTMVLGVAKIREWEHWEHSINRPNGPMKNSKLEFLMVHSPFILFFYIYVTLVCHIITASFSHIIRQFFIQRTIGYYRKLPIIRWIVSFFKQFYGSVTKADYLALRSGFIQEHFPANPKLNFHKYMLGTLHYDFKKIVGVSWYLWLFVIVFLLLNISGGGVELLLLVGAHLEHIITRLARELDENSGDVVKPSDYHFWCNNPKIIIYLIHFILFQNSFEIGFFFWVWTTYGFDSCIMEKLGYIVTKLVLGYSTLPLYALVSQMGSMFKQSIFDKLLLDLTSDWVGESSHPRILQNEQQPNDETIPTIGQGIATSMTELSTPVLIPEQVQGPESYSRTLGVNYVK